MKSGNKLEKIIFGVSLMGLVITGLLFFFSDRSKYDVTNFNENLGYVQPKGQDIRVRSIESKNWEPIKKETNIYEYDKIFTGSKSTAIIKLKSNKELIIQPNSLVVINSNKKNEENKNSIKGLDKLKTTKSKIIPNIDSTDEVSLDLVQGHIQIKNTENGHIEDVKSSSFIAANQNEIKNEKNNQRSEIPIELIEPSSNQIKWSQNDYQEITLKWSTPSLKSKIINYKIEISQDPSFQENVQIYETTKNEINIKLKSGSDYFWRVKSEENSQYLSSQSSISTYSLYLVKAPEIIQQENFISQSEFKSKNFNNKTILIDITGNINQPLKLTWIDKSISDSYDIQIANDSTFAHPDKLASTKDTSYNLHQISPGFHYLRVVSYNKFRDPLFSKPVALNFEIQSNSKIKTADLNTNLLSQITPETKKIERTVAQEKEETPSESIVIKDNKIETQEKIQLPHESPSKKHELLKPANFKDDRYTFEGDLYKTNTFELEWNSSKDSKLDQIQIASTPDFTNILYKENSVNKKYNWTPQKFGVYYARVKSFRNDSAYDEESQTSLSDIVQLNVYIQRPQIVNIKKITTAFNDKQELINKYFIQWNKAEIPTQALIQFSQDPEFKTSDISFTPDNQDIINLKEEGTYYVRVHYLNLDGKIISRYSKVETIENKKDFNLYNQFAYINQSSEFEFSVGAGYSRIDSKYSTNNSSAYALSDLGKEYRFNWTQNWTEHHTTKIGFKNQSWSYLNASVGSLQGTKQNLSGVSIGYAYNINNRLNVGIDFAHQERLFMPSYASGEATIEKHATENFKVHLNYVLYDLNMFNLVGGANYTYINQSEFSNLSTKSGSEYEVNLRLNQKMRSLTLFSEANYIIKNQKTVNTDESFKEIFLRLGVIFYYRENDYLHKENEYILKENEHSPQSH